ncbi:MAG: hypothetical protein RR980_00430 [Mucinivorans sp.]
MIRIKSVVVGLSLVVLLGMFSCAKDPSSILDGAEQATFQAWIKKNDPQAEKKESGIYIKFYEHGNLGIIVPKVDQSWLQLNYSLSMFDGSIAVTRDSSTSRLLGSWSPTTHFVDDFVAYYSKTTAFTYGRICEGLRDAFQYLRIGDSARIYIPSSLAYIDASPLSDNSGYVGQNVDYLNKPIYINVRVKDIINHPVEWEKNKVQDYARTRWGQLSKDSIAYGIYMRVIEDDPKALPITADSTVRYFFAERFLDHQLVLTNVESVAKAAKYYATAAASRWNYSVTEFMPTDFLEAKKDSTKQHLFGKIFLKMKAGQTVEVVSLSNWTSTGSSGDFTAVPQILPYEPRVYQIRTIKWSDSKKEADLNLTKLL